MTSKKLGDTTSRLMLLLCSRAARRVRPALHEDAGRVDAARQQRRLRHRDGADARHRAQPLQQLAVEARSCAFVVPVELRVDAEEQQVLRVEADVDLPQVLERAQEQPGADEQHERHRDLHDEQRAAEHAPRCRRRSGSSPSAPS